MGTALGNNTYKGMKEARWGGKEKLTCDNFAAEASAYPTMELWS